MKQEFVSARYSYYEGIISSKTHFSDRNVSLCNTFDYPSYSLAVEKTKYSYKTMYSLFDKIAFFLNKYYDLSIGEKNVSFSTLWYEIREKKRIIRNVLSRNKNMPLMGIFWLSKDLYEDKPGFRKHVEPDAQELNCLNNHLKHKYLKLHEDDWCQGANLPKGLTDTLSFSISKRDFEAKTLKLIKMVRAALIYLTMAVHCEEKDRKKDKSSKNIIVPSFLDDFEDRWKI